MSRLPKLIPILCLGFAAACTAPSGEAEQPEDHSKIQDQATPDEDPNQPEPPPASTTTVSVASVQMVQDCPDTEVEPEPPAGPAVAPSQPMPPKPGSPKPGPAAAKRKALPDSNGSFRQPCTQSTVQLALETTNEAPVAIEIKAVRLLSNGKTVGTLATRKPKLWTDNRYAPWDQTIAPGPSSKASYKLSLPDWSKVETAIGEPSFEHMFTLEIDIAIDGELRTVSSPAFPREEPHVIVT